MKLRRSKHYKSSKKMVLCLIGLALVCYGILYAVFLYVLDCDLELAFYEKFGKPISK